MTETLPPPIRVGLIGAGQIAREMHLPVLRALAEFEPVWVCDTSAASVRVAARAFGLRAIGPAEVATAAADVDVVAIAIPYGVRSAYYEQLAAHAGRIGLFVEKPFARTVAEHRERCARFGDERTACNYSRRALPSLALIQRLLAEQAFGPLRACRFEFGTVGSGSVGEKYYSDPKQAGGGLLMEIGVHFIDAALFCFAGTPAGPVTGRQVLEGGIDLHTEARVDVQLVDGRKIPFEFEITLFRQTENHLTFVFDQHVVTTGLFGDPWVRLAARGGGTACRLESETPWPSTTPYQVLGGYWRSFAEGLRTGKVNVTSAVTALGVTEIVEGCYALSRSP